MLEEAGLLDGSEALLAAGGGVRKAWPTIVSNEEFK